ncbi:hypothetical protein [uncultured Bosea sp.]|uniref:hypothetical protein n=1 Tax=uncultured Bosea sp. TaxID=211457 RepID=UPI0025F5E62B|nr:hypothetical protein [uncultured Bosea sp.]
MGMKSRVTYRALETCCDEVVTMGVSSSRNRQPKGARAGLMIGFAAPLLFLGALPRYDAPRSDNIGKSWREVGNALASAMERERGRLRDRKR